MRSPGRSPAVLAGASGSEGRQARGALSRLAWVTATTHWETPATVVVALVLVPMPMKAIANRKNASTMLIATPEPMMITRFHHGLL